MSRPRMTRLMQDVQARHGDRDLMNLLPEMINEFGLSATADRLRVSKATLGYWLLKLGIKVHRVALASDESLEIKRVAGGASFIRGTLEELKALLTLPEHELGYWAAVRGGSSPGGGVPLVFTLWPKVPEAAAA